MWTPTKRYARNGTIVVTIAVLLIVLVIGVISHVSLRDLLIMALMVIVIDILIGTLASWLFLRIIYPKLGFVVEKPIISKAFRADLLKEEKIEYEVKRDDVLAFHLFNYEHSPILGRARRLMRFMLLPSIILMLLSSIVSVAIFGRNYISFAVGVGFFTVLILIYYIFSPPLIRKGFTKIVERDYGRGKDKLTRKHKLSISSETVTDITDMGESTTHWDTIEWIASTDQHLFMAVRGSGPHIVPRRAFTNEEAFKQFVDTVNTYYQVTEASNLG
ncbi:MAG: YcxB family protein [Chloroflexota bacterium]